MHVWTSDACLASRVLGQKLEQVATVRVRDGSTLVVTVSEEDNLKHVEAAIYDAKLPSITPQTGYANIENSGEKAEEARVQCRKLHQTNVKKGKYEKRSVELEVFQDLLDKYVAEVNKILVDMKKTLGVHDNPSHTTTPVSLIYKNIVLPRACLPVLTMSTNS
ncbi:hypothetical protein F5146DRAFT_1224265 [Armillaria mellea]|nr:hypothetical protein F5146DRAFT_1224265 [Armillaria mellea]